MANGLELLGSSMPMAAKPRIPLPTSRRKAAQAAVLLAMSLLQDERVREQLRKAPVAAREWAASRRVADGTERPSAGALERLDPTVRFGQKGIERRIAALDRNARLVFPDPTDPNGPVILDAIDELSRAASISATMPLNERRKARARISDELTRLERALVDAVLPPTPPALR
jgi:hypothetical protein